MTRRQLSPLWKLETGYSSSSLKMKWESCRNSLDHGRGDTMLSHRQIRMSLLSTSTHPRTNQFLYTYPESPNVQVTFPLDTIGMSPEDSLLDALRSGYRDCSVVMLVSQLTGWNQWWKLVNMKRRPFLRQQFSQALRTTHALELQTPE